MMFSLLLGLKYNKDNPERKTQASCFHKVGGAWVKRLNDKGIILSLNLYPFLLNHLMIIIIEN